MKLEKDSVEMAKVRRLGTGTSVKFSPTHLYTTLWIWYWKNEDGIWVEYVRVSDYVNNINSFIIISQRLKTSFVRL